MTVADKRNDVRENSGQCFPQMPPTSGGHGGGEHRSETAGARTLTLMDLDPLYKRLRELEARQNVDRADAQRALNAADRPVTPSAADAERLERLAAQVASLTRAVSAALDETAEHTIKDIAPARRIELAGVAEQVVSLVLTHTQPHERLVLLQLFHLLCPIPGTTVYHRASTLEIG